MHTFQNINITLYNLCWYVSYRESSTISYGTYMHFSFGLPDLTPVSQD